MLHLSADTEESDVEEQKLNLRVSTCTTCGQHYFQHALADFEYTGRAPGGGTASGDAVYWEALDETHGGTRILLIDRLISAEEEEPEEDHPKLTRIFLCGRCGTAHATAQDRCLTCGGAGPQIPLQAVQQKKDRPGLLSTCVCCGATGRLTVGRFREPIRTVRSVNVADVHVLAQDMVHHAQRKRLLVFADNRQEAAFQAGWMRDHARRFRLRALIARELEARSLSIGDLTHYLDQALEDDDALSMALLPEVWAVAPKDAGGVVHREQRRYLLRILLLREITAAAKQQIGLEAWGRLRVDYVGLSEGSVFVRHWSDRLGMSSDELVEGIAAFLDINRRRRLLLDRIGKIFSRIWAPGTREIENGYLPLMSDVPKGLKLTREGREASNRIVQWISATGHRTSASEIAMKWGAEDEDVPIFLRDLWDELTGEDLGLLVPVTLTGSRGNALPNFSGTYQLDADKLMLSTHRGIYRCRICRRRTSRRTPGERCLAWRCEGTLEFLPEDPDSYDLRLLDQEYEMLRPREHTAMVPTGERERIEQIFKGNTDNINALVCTQTLELGVDIGALDAVLMRNVPPRPANYWQRAGRAGRRHRMAVNLTYCRGVSHDRAYFAEPLKMLEGRVDPPAFNLANELMVAKHVHATVITRLHQLAREGSDLSHADREEVEQALRTTFPPRVSEYLFDDDGQVRPQPLDVRVLHTVITKHQTPIELAVTAAFRQGWPSEDGDVVRDESLALHILGMTGELEAVIRRLHRRLRWALEQMDVLEKRRKRFGVLDDEHQSFYGRCGRLVRRLKGADRRRRRDAEGVDDIVTYSVLAAEGFLPGYGLDAGSILGMAEVPRWVRGLDDFDLPRPPALALREYVPGNLIYANGQEFLPRRYALDVEEDRHATLVFEVNLERQAVREVGAGATGDLSAGVIRSIPVCDVTLVHASRITDEEENRFQMSVAIYGRELGLHEGGQAFRWGPREVRLRKGVRFQLVNVGTPFVIHTRGEFGYPVCRVCGQSMSPFSSPRQRDDFVEKHREWCGQTPEATAFHSDLSVDALTLPGCSDPEEAYSITEAIRFAAGEVLDMNLEDLHIMVLGRSDRDEVDAVLYDPMPGGSGLLKQICARFSEIIAAARGIVKDCPSNCPNSCIDCLQRYRNAFYHKYLNRHLILEKLNEWGTRLEETHPIPSKMPTPTPDPEAQPVNEAERKLSHMLKAAEFPDGHWQEQHPLPRPLNSTTPDVTFDDPDDDERKVFVYLDGLSQHIHGNPETRDRDMQIRGQLRSEGHDVIEITAAELDDEQAMTRYFKRLARLLIGRDAVDRVSGEASQWFAAREVEGEPTVEEAETTILPFRLVEMPEEADLFRTCVPIYSLKAAAGGFSEGQAPEPEGWAELSISRLLNEDMFLAQVVGKSMEPRIPDGSWCLFSQHVAGSRYGRILVVQHRDIADPETGGSYTIKRYERPPQDAEEGAELQGRIMLSPLNPEFEPMIIEDGDDNVAVIAELAEVLGGESNSRG